MTRRPALFVLLSALASAALPSVTHAQVGASGPSFLAIPMGVRGSSVAFDPTNQVYLVVGGYGVVKGRFVRPDRTFVGGEFQISTTGQFTHYPDVAYSPHANGGQGAFLVAWHEGGGSTSNFVHARLVTTTGLLGSELELGSLAMGSTPTWWEASPAIEYSPTSQNFLVAWQSNAYRIHAARVSAAGAVIDRFAITDPVGGTGERDPSVAYNPTTNQYLVAYSGWGSSGAHVTARLVSAANAALSTPQIVALGTATYITEASFSSTAGTYLVTWYQAPAGILSRVVHENGTPIGSVTPVSNRIGTYDSLGLAFNTTSGTYAMVGHDTQSAENGAVELSVAGAPASMAIVTNAGGPIGNFYPKVASHTSAAQWMLTTAHNFSSLVAQVFVSGTTGGSLPPPPPPPPPAPPAPTPSPTPTGNTAERARADFNGDGSSDILWQNTGNGNIATWRMSAENLLSALPLSPGTVADLGWKIVGSLDLNKDGRPDILWRHDNGLVAIWFMRGETLLSAELLTPNPIADLGWRVVATGDVDADGSADILWQHTDGRVGVWYYNGTQYRSADVFIDLPDDQWRVVAAGDMNADGRLDLVWQHAITRNVGVWFMRGQTLVSAVAASEAPPPADWRIAGLIDVDRDGKPDILWQNGATGDVAAWMMDGYVVRRGQFLNPARVADTNWKIAGPK